MAEKRFAAHIIVKQTVTSWLQKIKTISSVPVSRNYGSRSKLPTIRGFACFFYIPLLNFSHDVTQSVLQFAQHL
jgi:hypothetical protein